MVDKPQIPKPGDWTACMSLLDNKPTAFHITAHPKGSLHPICEYEPHGKKWAGIRTPQDIAMHARLIATAPNMARLILALIKWDKDYPVGSNAWAGLVQLDKIIACATLIIADIEGDIL